MSTRLDRLEKDIKKTQMMLAELCDHFGTGEKRQQILITSLYYEVKSFYENFIPDTESDYEVIRTVQKLYYILEGVLR